MTGSDPLAEYRGALIDRLAEQPVAFAALTAQLPEAEWHRSGAVDGLTLHQLAAHIRDAVVKAFYPRIERILAEESPHLEPFPHHYWTIEHGYRVDEPLAEIVTAFTATHHTLLKTLRTLPAEDWARIGFHPPSGPRTILWWAERIHGHTAAHLLDLRHAIAA